MGSPNVLQRLGDKASRYISGVKTLAPEDSEVQSLEENQKQVNAAAGQPRMMPIITSEYHDEPLNPQARYGDRGNEKRFTVDAKGNMTEIPMVHPQHVDHYTMAVPYPKDEDVIMKPIIPQSLTQPMPTQPAPVYDEGGDVSTDDGKHQMAVLEDGERVLTPEENAQFKQEHPDEAAAHAQPTQEAELRPFGEVKAEKEKAAAPHPALSPIESKSTEEGQPIQEKPEQLPTASHAERVAIKKDQQDAMGKGVNGLTQLGLANIHAKQLGLKGETMDASDGSVTDKMTAPAGLNGGPGGPQEKSGPGLPQIPQAAPATTPPTATSEQGADFKTRLEQLKLDHAKALAERTPDGKVRADYIQAQINDLHKNNPWGTSGNHPGILGQLGHVAAKVGNIAGNIVAPNTMAIIPGTEANRHLEQNNLQHQTAQDAAAVAAQDKADKPSGIPGYKQVTGGAVDPKNPDAGPQVAFYDEKDPSKIVYGGPLTPKATPAEAKQNFQKVLAKIGTADAADPAQQMQAIEAAHKSGGITDDEYRNSIGYLGANNAPATQATAAGEKRVAGKVLYFDTPKGRAAYTPEEAKAAGLNPQEGYIPSQAQVEKDREKSVTFNGITHALTQYQRDIEAGGLEDKDRRALATVVEESESPDYISKLMAGAFDALLGHPVTGYSEKLSKGVLTKNQYEDLSPAGRRLLADYYTTMMAHFANVKSVMGSIPRNEKLITTEMHTIPKPYLSGEETKPTFDNYQDFMQLRNGDNVTFPTPAAQGTAGPAKEETPAATTPTTRPRKEATAKPAAKSNNGYSANNPFAPKPQP